MLSYNPSELEQKQINLQILWKFEKENPIEMSVYFSDHNNSVQSKIFGKYFIG